MRIEPHEAVLNIDLPAIFAFIARDNPAAAEGVLNAVESTFDQLARQPECGVPYQTRNQRLRDVRMLPVNRFPTYLIFYRLELNVVRVFYVVSGLRHLDRLFVRLPRN